MIFHMEIQSRKSLRPTEEKVREILTEENRKHRISRILQVRQQANELSAARRQAVQQARENEVAKLKQELAQQWQQQQDQKLQQLQEKLDVAVNSIGLAHKAALDQKAAAAEEATRREILLQRAEDRGLRALHAERHNRELAQQQYSKQMQLRQQVKVVEQQRAERIAKRPTPPAFRPPEIREPVSEPPPVLVQEAGTLVTSQYRPTEQLVTRHRPGSSDNVDARARARAERCRLERAKDEAQRKEAERLKRASERGKAAEERQKLIETRDRLARLMSEDSLHAFYRGEDVGGYPQESLDQAYQNPLQFPSTSGSKPLTISDQTDLATLQSHIPTGVRSFSDAIDQHEAVTSDGISGMESVTDGSDMDGGIGISGVDSASDLSRFVLKDRRPGIDGLTSSLSNTENFSGISGVGPSHSNLKYTNSCGIESEPGVSACDFTSDSQSNDVVGSATPRSRVYTTHDLRDAPHILAQDEVSPSHSSSSDFDAYAALRQAEELMAKVRQMKEERLGSNVRGQQTSTSEVALSVYNREKDADSSSSWRTIDATSSEDERLLNKKSGILKNKGKVSNINQMNLLSQRQIARTTDSLLSSQLTEEIDYGQRKVSETETSSFDEEIGVVLKFNEESSDNERRQEPNYRNVDSDRNLDESLNYILEMKSSLGMATNPVSEEIETSPSVQIPDQVYRNLQLLKQNRKNIDNKLEAAIRSRGAEPRRRRRQRSRGEINNRVQLLKSTSVETPETSSENSIPETRSYVPRTGARRLGPLADDHVHPSTGLQPQGPKDETLPSTPSMNASLPFSSSFASAGTSSVCSVTTPVRMYREEVKQDGKGERPLRRRDKFELQKRIVLQNYIKKLLDTRRSEILSSSSIEGSGIDVSSIKVLNKLAGGRISIESPRSSSSAATSDKDYCSSSSSGLPLGASDTEAPASRVDRFTTEQELDRVPSRLSDVEEQSRPEVGIQVPSEESLSVQINNRNMGIQVPSVDHSSSGTSVPDHQVAISYASQTPVSEFSSEELISVSQQPRFSNVASLPSSIEVSAAPVFNEKLLFSSSSVALPTLPSTSTPTVAENVPRVSGAVSSSVSPIVGDDAISTVDQFSSDQFQAADSCDRPLQSQEGVDFQILKENLQKVKSGNEEAQRPAEEPHEVGSATARSQDISFNSIDLGMVSSSLMSSEVFSELSPEELKIKKEAVEKKKAIYLRLLELNEIKQQYMLLQQQQERNATIAEEENPESEVLIPNENVAHRSSSRQVIPGEHTSQNDENYQGQVDDDLTDSRDQFREDQIYRYNALVSDEFFLQQKFTSRTDTSSDGERLLSQNLITEQKSQSFEKDGKPLSSQFNSPDRMGRVTASAGAASVVAGSSKEWATINESNKLGKGYSMDMMENASGSRPTPRSQTASDQEGSQNFTSVEISEGLISMSGNRPSPLQPQYTQHYSTEESLEEGLISTIDQEIATGGTLDSERDEHSRTEEQLQNCSGSRVNDSFKKLLEIVDFRKLSGLSDARFGQAQAEASAILDKSSQAAYGMTDAQSIEDGASSVRNTSDDCLAYDADYSSKGTTSSTHSDDVVPEKIALQLKKIEGVLRDCSEASVKTASTTSGDTLLADLGSNALSETLGSSSPSDLGEVLRKYGWARGMLNKMNRLDQGYSSSTSSNS